MSVVLDLWSEENNLSHSSSLILLYITLNKIIKTIHLLSLIETQILGPSKRFLGVPPLWHLGIIKLPQNSLIQVGLSDCCQYFCNVPPQYNIGNWTVNSAFKLSSSIQLTLKVKRYWLSLVQQTDYWFITQVFCVFLQWGKSTL